MGQDRNNDWRVDNRSIVLISTEVDKVDRKWGDDKNVVQTMPLKFLEVDGGVEGLTDVVHKAAHDPWQKDDALKLAALSFD